jgi:hypothetical protein
MRTFLIFVIVSPFIVGCVSNNSPAVDATQYDRPALLHRNMSLEELNAEAGRMQRERALETTRRAEVARADAIRVYRDVLIGKFKKNNLLTIDEWKWVLFHANKNPVEIYPMNAAQVLALLGKPDRANANGSWMEYDGKLLNQFTDTPDMLQLHFHEGLKVVWTVNEGR